MKNDQMMRTSQSQGNINNKEKKISTWSQYMNYMHLFDLDYAIRAKAEAIFQDKQHLIFEFFITND